jgi:Fe2+ transport system protein B
VVPVVAKRRRGLAELSKAVLAAMTQPASPIKSVELSQEADQASRHSKLIKRYAFIERIVSDAAESSDHGLPNLSEKIDRVVTHRIFGPVILLLVMLLVFQTIFSWASLPMNLIDHVFSALCRRRPDLFAGRHSYGSSG